MLRVRLLGGLRLELDGQSLEMPPGRRLRALVAWLALNPGPQPRARIAARFWPDVLDESARGSLRTALLELRRALGAEAARYLQATRDSIGLGPEPELWVDVRAFGRAVAEGNLEEALALVGEELLPELDDDWVYVARDAHREAVSSVLARLADRAEASGDAGSSIGYARRLVTHEPLDEEAARRLIRLLAANGDRPAALAVFARLRDRLRDDLRIAPSAVTRELIEQVRGGASADAAFAESSDRPLPLPAALEREVEADMFGRGPELERLRASFARVRDQGLACVFVAGEPGVGKTRLVAELCRGAHAAGATVLYGRCVEDELRPYEAFVEALRGYVLVCPADRLLAETGAGAPWLARLLPELSEVLPEAAQAPAGDPQGERWRMFDAVTTLLASAARAAPVVLALDDLHWSDRTTLQLLDHLVRSSPQARILVLGAYRETEVDRSHPLSEELARLRRAHALDVVRVGGLSEAAVGELISSVSAGGVAGDLARPVFEETEGNPLFVHAILRDVETAVADGTVARPAEALTEIGVPESVKDLLGRRLARLTETSSKALAIAAVIGREFPFEMLERLTGLPENELVEALEQALEASVIAEIPRAPGRFVFAHALVRETVYESLSAVRRARLHLRVGDAIEELFANSLEERHATLAHHYSLAGDAEKALRYDMLAGQAAERVFAADEAVRSYSRALDAAAALGLGPDDPLVYELRCRRGREVFTTGDYSGSLADLDAAVAGARAAGDAQAEMEALFESGVVRRTGDVEAAIVCHERALELAESVGDLRGQVAHLARLSLCHAQSLRLADALGLGERALALARDAGDEQAVATALDAVKRVALQLGDLQLLESATGELLELRDRAVGQWPLERWHDWVLLERAFVPLAQARWEQAFAGLQEALDTNRRLMDRMGEPLFLDALCWCHRSRGELERAIAVGQDAVARAEGVGSPEWIAWTCATLGWTLLDAGAAAASIGPLERGLALVEGHVARAQLLRCTALLAGARARTGDLDKALALARRAEVLMAGVTTPPGQGSLFCAHADLAVARVWIEAAEPARAEALVRPLLPAAQAAGWQETLAVASVLAGRCRVALGEPRDGRELVVQGAEIAVAAGLGPARAEAEAALAELTGVQAR